MVSFTITYFSHDMGLLLWNKLIIPNYIINKILHIAYLGEKLYFNYTLINHLPDLLMIYVEDMTHAFHVHFQIHSKY